MTMQRWTDEVKFMGITELLLKERLCVKFIKHSGIRRDCTTNVYEEPPTRLLLIG